MFVTCLSGVLQTASCCISVSLDLHCLVAQVHYDIWRHPADVQRRQPAGHTTSLAYRLLPQSLQDAYADGNARLTDLISGQVSGMNLWIDHCATALPE